MPALRHPTPPSVPLDDRLSPGTLVSGYRIEGILACGGMAVVYSAIHPDLGKRAAIKVIRHALLDNADAVLAFANEARLIEPIRQGNLVDVFAFGQLPDGRSYFVMEWLEGESLRSCLSRHAIAGHPLSMERCCEILIQLCDALEAAHGGMIAHLDLKPENVHLVPTAHEGVLVKLIDFGIAKRFDSESQRERSPSVVPNGFVAGTPTYMSPEQATGGAVSSRSDVYSLGVMAYEMFLGEPPFSDTSEHSLLFLHVNAQPSDPQLKWPAIPFRLEHLLLHMLAKDPLERPPLSLVRDWLVKLRTMAAVTPSRPALQPALAAMTTDPVVPFPPVAPRPRVRPRRSPRYQMTTAMVVSAMALLLGLGLMMVDRPPLVAEAHKQAAPTK